jgi:flavin reductase (DIM6/NTAB) family NADH-FMN oxidoreductase RutF
VIIDSATLDPVHAYKLLIGSILPRAIGWISTLSKDGIANLVLHGSRPPSEADEFVEVGLEKAPSLVVRPPRVSGAPISMECRVYKIIPVGEIGDHMIIGEVSAFPYTRRS